MHVSGFTFTILGQPRPWARAGRNGRSTYTPNPYANYRRMVGMAAIAAGMRSEVGPFRVSVEVWRKDCGTYDVDNLLKGVLDGLVRAKALKDDDIRYVRAVSGEHAGEDKEHPRCVVRLELMQ